MYNPRKRVPATVEFADIPARPRRIGRRRRCSTSRPYRNADALVHVLRAFDDPAIPHRRGRRSTRAAMPAAMEDELHPGGSRGGREAPRAPREGPEEDAHGRARARAGASCCGASRSSRTARRCARWRSREDDRQRLRGFQFLSAKPLLLVLNVDEAAIWRAALDQALARYDLRGVADGGPRRALVAVCAKIELEIAAARARRRGGVPGGPRPHGIRPRPRHPRQLRPARLHLVLHRGRGRVPRVVDPARHAGAGRRRRDPHRSLARVHPRRGRRLRARSSRRGTMPACREHGEVRLEGKEYIVLGRRHHQRPVRDVIP